MYKRQEKYIKNPVKTLKSIKDNNLKLSSLNYADLNYIASSSYITKEFSKYLDTDPNKFIDNALKQLNNIKSVQSKSKTYVEVEYCEQDVYKRQDINNGIDCSAFVQYVWAHFGVSIPRATPGQCQAGVAVPSLAEALPGDLILYSAAGTDIDSTHVVMYLGNGKIVHASNSAPYPQGGIKIDYVYGPIYKIRRVAKQG